MLTVGLLKIIAWSSAFFAAAIGIAILRAFRHHAARRGRMRGIELPALLLAMLAAVAGCCLVALPLVSKDLINEFGLIRIAYTNVAVVPPMLGLWLLITAQRSNPMPRPRYLRAIGVMLLLPAPVCAYASLIAPYQTRIERADVPIAGLRADSEPIRIAVLADLQTDRITAHERDAVTYAMASRPDLIVLPGDFFHGTQRQLETEAPRFRELLNRLDAPAGVFACQGNIDRRYDLGQLLEGTPVRLLHNEITVVVVRGTRLAIGGLEWEFSTNTAIHTLREMRQNDADARILLCHSPDVAVLAKVDDLVDLVISGHTHGGQIVLPGFGPPFVACYLPREVAAGGLHRVDDQLLYVSRGIGYERYYAPPMRFFCPPEVSILSLQAGRR